MERTAVHLSFRDLMGNDKRFDNWRLVERSSSPGSSGKGGREERRGEGMGEIIFSCHKSRLIHNWVVADY